jgi:ubiquinone/menaquinone biosynthesis C-methylase UbiE
VSFNVSAVEPSASFAAAARERLPGVDIRQSVAERLPFGDDAFDAALREQCRRGLPGGSFEISATAWTATGRA